MELNFLNIADTPEDLQSLRELLAAFEGDRHIRLTFSRVSWDKAWQILLLDALEGKGPHVSQIGSTWGATMAMLDALRTFNADDISSIGGAQSFLPSTWETVKFANRPEVWAIPWSIYTFVLYYRRDLLSQAHLDAKEAFASPGAMREAVQQLSQGGAAPWAFPTLRPYADLVHIASSWARANGGDFMSANGREPLFAQPEASAGLMDFFELFRFIPPSWQGLSVEACTQAFARGDTALLVGGVEVANELLISPEASPEVRDNLGMTTLPGVPWIGGDHLVVWKSVLADAEHEKAALDLIRYLSRKETQTQLFKMENVLPARSDAYEALTFPLDTTAATVQQILKKGRPHPPLRLWRRLETFLDEMLSDIGNSVLRNSALPASDIVKPMLDEYERKLTIMLKG